MNRCKWLAFCVLFLGFAALVSSQTGLTSLRGTVTDSSGAVLAGVNVKVENAATGFHAASATDQSGAYEFPQLPPGKYTIAIGKSGFGNQTKAAELLVSQPATINFTLTVQSMTETIEVSDIAQTVNTSDATLGNAVSNATIQALPMEGRNVPDLLSLQPGVVYLGRNVNDPQSSTGQDTDSRSGAVSGARSDQGNITLDGVDNNDQRQGYAFTGVLRSTLDSVEEFRVTTTQSNADSGRSSGAQVTLVTKSGTNRFHGSVYEYNRTNFGLANDWFNKQSEVTSGLPNKPGQLIRNTYGGTFGGPIKKDRLFFFLNYEGQKTQENRQQSLTVPTASFAAGNVSYACDTSDPKCPTTGPTPGIETLSAANVATMDPNCTTTCPWGHGEDPNAIATLMGYPGPNSAGGDGLNTGGFTFSAPNPIKLNTYIAKLDYQLSDSQKLFVRGNLQGDRISSAPQFPSEPPAATIVDTAKGIAIGHTWALSSSRINNFRYGYIREALNNVGAGNSSFSDLVGLSPLTAENTTTQLSVPLHTFVDDFTWVKGKHTLQFGVNYRLIHNNAISNNVSFSSASSGDANISQAQIAGTGQSFDPAAFGFPAVDPGFITSYDNAITAIAGVLSTINVHNNYKVTSSTAANLLPSGASIVRDFKANEFEWYVQDSWRVKPNLTVTAGLRHSLLQTPYEINGQQVAPNINLHQWFLNRGIAASQGTGNQPEFAFAPSGQSRGGAPYWPMNKLNFAPRFAVAYSPDAKTSIRAGAGLYFDHYGEGIVDGFSEFGSFGLTSTQAAPSNIFTPDDAPRYTSRTVVPALGSAPQSTVTYPAAPPDDPLTTGFTFNSDGIDGSIKTPYSIAADFSVQRVVGGGWTFEAAYVGRFGRHLLQQRDLAAATDLVDPKSGLDYYGAARLISQFALQNGEDPTATITAIPYFENLFPTAAAGGFSATQNIYTGDLNCNFNSCFEWATRPGREVGAPFRLGLICSGVANGGFTPACNGPAVPYWDPQFSSLFAWSSIGNSSYNAAQFTMRHPMSHGLQVDFSYTYSKSTDLGSDTERTNPQGTTSTTTPIGLGTSTILSYIENPWNPGLNKAPSDFDLHHVVTGTGVYELPFGKGKMYMGSAHGVMDAVIGGWQLSGLLRWTSALPFSIIDNHGFTQNFLFNSNLVQTAPVSSGKFISNQPGTVGAPYAFANSQAVVAGVFPPGAGGAAPLTPTRFPYPGEAGSRNNFRGQGFFGIDTGLTKSWQVHEGMALKFAWEVFNATNSVRFNDSTFTSLDAGSDDASGFGLYHHTLTLSRVQQFSLRFSF